MLTSIEVEAPGARDVLRLPLEENEDPLQWTDYHVFDVDGLDPVKASFASTTLAREDGVYIQDSKLDLRNIVLTLGMNPDYADRTIQSLRANLYRYFMPKGQVTLRFIDSDYETKTVVGYVESNEFPIFTKEPTATISILCPNPIFSSVEESEITLDTTPNSDRLEVVYDGSYPTGVVLRCYVKGGTPLNQFQFEIQSEVLPTQRLTYYGMVNNNRGVILDTRLGERSIVEVSGTTHTNVLHNVSITSDWPQLHPGINLLRVYSVSDPQACTISYRNVFGGL